MRRYVLPAICGLAVAVGALELYALAARFILHGPVTATSLATSVTAEAPSAGTSFNWDGRCARARPGTWRCNVLDSEGSGSVDYRVAVTRGSSCWRADLVLDHSEGGMPASLDGCVRRWQWSPWDLLGG